MGTEATITIRTENGSTRYHVIAAEAVNDSQLRSVLNAAIEMACALLNAVFRKDISEGKDDNRS